MFQSNMENRKLLPPFPNGWYTLGLSRELPPGSVLSLKFMGQDIVLFRTRSGVASVMEAYCPHLGAHLGYGGTVEGESIRCPFHGFRFDAQGNCAFIPYGTRLPPKAKARVLPVREVHGLILAYHDSEGHAPEWEVPDLDVRHWSPLLAKAWHLRGHPQETSENSVDIGHFSAVHGYTSVEMLKELVTDGPYLNVKYVMTRAYLLGPPIRAEFEIHVHGLGYSRVDAHVPQYGIQTRLFVLATPTDGQNITLRLALSLHEATQPQRIHSLLALLPRSLINAIIARTTFNGFAHDTQQDFIIWQHKRYVQPPILAEGDGPIGRYRLWAKQFYRGADVALI